MKSVVIRCLRTSLSANSATSRLATGVGGTGFNVAGNLELVGNECVQLLLPILLSDCFNFPKPGSDSANTEIHHP